MALRQGDVGVLNVIRSLLLEPGHYPMLAIPARMERILGFGSVKASAALNGVVAIVSKPKQEPSLAFGA